MGGKLETLGPVTSRARLPEAAVITGDQT
jgi:hypothetical protein